MTGWTATSTKPALSSKSLELDYQGDKRKQTAKQKAQLAAAETAAASLISKYEGPVTVTVSGVADSEHETDSIHIYLGES